MENSAQPQPKDGGQMIYTTVGSIYNPQATPLQPPARRGRTVKWPPHVEPTAKPFPGTSFRGAASPPTTANSFQQYSPLQQNSARAVSPGTFTTNAAVSAMSLGTTYCTALDTSHGKHDHAITHDVDDEDDDTVEDGNLRPMSVKSLTNLASYPNPMQKNAQKILSRARPTANAASATWDTMRSARSDPVALSQLEQCDGVGEHDYQYRKDLSFKTVLSQGFGAPRPLTAGPPGLRPYKSSTLDYIAQGRQRSLWKIEISAAHSTSHMISQDRQAVIEREPTPSLQGDSAVSIQGAFGIGNHQRAGNMVDTLTADRAREYYPLGFPSNFNYRTSYIAPEWTKDCPLQNTGISKICPRDDVDAHRANVDWLYYAGNDMINKTIEDVLLEKKHRDFERTMGIHRQEKQHGKGKVYNRKLTVDEANAIPITEHIVPLLSMAYQTFINQSEYSGFMHQSIFTE